MFIIIVPDLNNILCITKKQGLFCIYVDLIIQT